MLCLRLEHGKVTIAMSRRRTAVPDTIDASAAPPFCMNLIIAYFRPKGKEKFIRCVGRAGKCGMCRECGVRRGYGITVGAAAYREMCSDANFVGFRERNFYLKIAFCIAFT